MSEAEARRLRWRCRRGYLELDLILQTFVRDAYWELSEEQRAAFHRLLALPDSVLLGAIFPSHSRAQAGEIDADSGMEEIIARLSKLAPDPV